MAERGRMATSFGGVAAVYERGRPGYPLDAVAWLLEPARHEGRAPRVADVGAGTGKLARAAVELGAEVVAIDPDPQMLAHIRGIPTFVGTAESLPLPDASVDAVLLGQAWHWVDVPRASAEAARVLRSGGALGLAWNLLDESVPWVARLIDILHGSVGEAALSDKPPTVDPPFATPEERLDRWSRAMTRDDVFALAWSRSYLITAVAEERGRVERELGALLDEIGATGDDEIDLPYTTRAFRVIRP